MAKPYYVSKANAIFKEGKNMELVDIEDHFLKKHIADKSCFFSF